MKTLKFIGALALALFSLQSNAQSLSIESFGISGGEQKELVINLSNPNNDLIGVQFNLELSDGLSLVKKSNGKATYTVGTLDNEHVYQITEKAGYYQFVIVSLHIANKFVGTEGSLVTLTVQAADGFKSGYIKLYDIALANVQAVEFNPEDVVLNIVPSGIQDATRDEAQTRTAYTLSGLKADNLLTKGIYIVNGKKVVK